LTDAMAAGGAEVKRVFQAMLEMDKIGIAKWMPLAASWRDDNRAFPVPKLCCICNKVLHGVNTFALPRLLA
jgi:hypothetical protein